MFKPAYEAPRMTIVFDIAAASIDQPKDVLDLKESLLVVCKRKSAINAEIEALIIQSRGGRGEKERKGAFEISNAIKAINSV